MLKYRLGACRTSVGVLRLDAHKLLNDCLSTHIARRIASACASRLSFSSPPVPFVPAANALTQSLGNLIASSRNFGSSIASRCEHKPDTSIVIPAPIASSIHASAQACIVLHMQTCCYECLLLIMCPSWVALAVERAS